MVHVDRLVLFAGPPGSGKSTTIQRLQAGNLPFLSEQLGLGSPSLWKCILAKELRKLSEAQMDQVICHYDFLGQWRRNLLHQAYEEDDPLGILGTSNEITFVTLWATPETLADRLELRQPSLLKFILKSVKSRNTFRRTRELRAIQRSYAHPPELLFQYDKWFRFCGMHSAKAHWIMDTRGDAPQLFHLSKWPEIKCEVTK